MTMHRTERMAALMAEIDNATAAKILRQMVSTVQFVRDHEGPELTTAEEFWIAASHIPEARKIQDQLEAQEWDAEHVNAFMLAEGLNETRANRELTIVTDRDGAEHKGSDLRQAIRAYKDHKEALIRKAQDAFLAGGWKQEAPAHA